VIAGGLSVFEESNTKTIVSNNASFKKQKTLGYWQPNLKSKTAPVSDQILLQDEAYKLTYQVGGRKLILDGALCKEREKIKHPFCAHCFQTNERR